MGLWFITIFHLIVYEIAFAIDIMSLNNLPKQKCYSLRNLVTVLY